MIINTLSLTFTRKNEQNCQTALPLRYSDFHKPFKLQIIFRGCFSAVKFLANNILTAGTQRRGGLAQAGGTQSVIRTTNGQIPHKRSLEVTPPLAPNRVLHAGLLHFYFYEFHYINVIFAFLSTSQLPSELSLTIPDKPNSQNQKYKSD